MNPDGETGRCQGCGARIVAHSTLEHCPGCLVELGLGALPDSAPAEPDTRVFTARRFGDYELLEQLGRGGMGLVYRARQTSLNRTVALKMVLDSQMNSPLALRRFEIEAEAAARLEHPNIVSIFEIGSVEGQPFISMRFIEGESLAQKLARGEFGPPLEARTKTEWTRVQERVARLMATVARAIHYAHQHGVIHRDIKPGNILIDAEGQPHLSDFGLAMLTDAAHRVSQTGALIGTLSYLAPEQATGTTASAATDIYSLGAVLYELLTGDVPFSAATPAEVLRAVTEQPPQSPSALHKDIDRDLETICLKCLEKSPSNRYSSARALAEDLERWQRREPILARPVGPILQLGRWIRRYPVGAALIVSLFVGLLVSLSFLRVVVNGKRAADQQRAKFENTREAIFRMIGVSKFWENPNTPIPIPSEFLAQAINADPGIPVAGKTERYQIGMLLEEDPAGVVIGYAHLIRKLERAVSKSMGYTVLFDLMLYHDDHEAGINGLLMHEVDIFKIGGSSFLKANKADAGIRPLVGQNLPKNGIIFARKGSGISTIEDLMNKSVAIKGQGSTVSMWGAFYLAKAGIPDANIEVLPRGEVRLNDDPLGQQVGGAAGKVLVRQSPIIASVLSSRFDAGIESETVYREHERSVGELVLLQRFPSSRVYWLASSALPKEIASAFTNAMVALRDPILFNGLPDLVNSYSKVTSEELEDLRKAEAIFKGRTGAGE